MTPDFKGLTDADQLDTTVTVLDLVRSGVARTRAEISRIAGLGRNVVSHRVGQLVGSRLLEEGTLGASTGGRAPRELRFRADAGYVLVADVGATGLRVGCADLAGNVIAHHQEPCDVAEGPRIVLDRIVKLFSDLCEALVGEVWGIGVGLPGPVEFATGRPVAPPIMPGWDGHDVRGHLVAHFDVPVWVDNDVNLMVLGEFRHGIARGQSDVVYIKVGTGIGAGLVSGQRLHRGAQGCAGDIGHIAAVRDSPVRCRCGQHGCLEALVGGGALIRDAQLAGEGGRSRLLAGIVAEGRQVTLADIGQAMSHGDPVAVDLVTNSAQLVGETLCSIVNFFNPGLVLLGGQVPDLAELYLSTVRQAVLRRSLPLATRSLRVERSPLGPLAGLTGGASLVVDELLSRERIGRWIEYGTPVGRPELVA